LRQAAGTLYFMKHGRFSPQEVEHHRSPLASLLITLASERLDSHTASRKESSGPSFPAWLVAIDNEP